MAESRSFVSLTCSALSFELSAGATDVAAGINPVAVADFAADGASDDVSDDFAPGCPVEAGALLKIFN